MAKQKEKSELEFLRAENRLMKSQIKHYKKELGRKSKRESQYLDLEERTAEAMLEEIEEEKVQEANRKDLCLLCKSPLNKISIGNRYILECTGCEFRSASKKA